MIPFTPASRPPRPATDREPTRSLNAPSSAPMARSRGCIPANISDVSGLVSSGICDPHHHFWDFRSERIPYQRYLLHELAADVNCGRRRCANTARAGESWLLPGPCASWTWNRHCCSLAVQPEEQIRRRQLSGVFLRDFGIFLRRGTDGSQTRRWREMDSNHRSRDRQDGFRSPQTAEAMAKRGRPAARRRLI